MSIRDAINKLLDKSPYIQVVTTINNCGVIKVIELDEDCIYGVNREVGKKETEKLVIPYDKIVLAKEWTYPEATE